MKRKKSINKQSLLVIMVVVSIVLMVLSAVNERATGPFRLLAGITVLPMQSGINHIGVWVGDLRDNFATMEALQEENALLRSQLEEASVERTRLLEDTHELARLQQLFLLDQNYSDYEKIGARVIMKNPGNWFHTFTINRGSVHGIRPDMNVIAGNGLVGIVTDVGPTWSTVQSIINDTSSVSAMVLTTSDRLVVHGDLTTMNEGRIPFDFMPNNENVVHVGDQVVTSHISDRFLQGILIGFVSEVNVHSNNLTRYGYITPAVDFENLQEVLVLTTTKADLIGE